MNALLVHEKAEKRLFGLGAPNDGAMRRGREALREHLDYLESLLETRDWLAGPRLSFADIAGAAHLSVVDFLGDAPWSRLSGDQDVVHEDQVPAVVPAAPGRPGGGRTAGRPLCRPRFLNLSNP